MARHSYSCSVIYNNVQSDTCSMTFYNLRKAKSWVFNRIYDGFCQGYYPVGKPEPETLKKVLNEVSKLKFDFGEWSVCMTYIDMKTKLRKSDKTYTVKITSN